VTFETTDGLKLSGAGSSRHPAHRRASRWWSSTGTPAIEGTGDPWRQRSTGTDCKTLLVLPDADHNDHALLAGDDMVQAIVRFLQPLT
jgi:hypothetical protein